MARGVSYSDAVILLGGRANRTVVALDRLVGGLLLVASATGAGFALSLLAPKSELARLSGDLVNEDQPLIGDRGGGVHSWSVTATGDRVRRVAHLTVAPTPHRTPTTTHHRLSERRSGSCTDPRRRPTATTDEILVKVRLVEADIKKLVDNTAK